MQYCVARLSVSASGYTLHHAYNTRHRSSGRGRSAYVVRACLAAGSNRLKPVCRLDHTREHDGQEDEEGDYCNTYSIVATEIDDEICPPAKAEITDSHSRGQIPNAEEKNPRPLNARKLVYNNNFIIWT